MSITWTFQTTYTGYDNIDYKAEYVMSQDEETGESHGAYGRFYDPDISAWKDTAEDQDDIIEMMENAIENDSAKIL